MFFLMRSNLKLQFELKTLELDKSVKLVLVGGIKTSSR